MAQFDESIRGQIQALLRVMNLTRCVNEDKVLCKIEEVCNLRQFFWHFTSIYCSCIRLVVMFVLCSFATFV